MCTRTSYAQVHELPQSHCGDNWEGTFCFHDCIYIYIYIYILKEHFSGYHILFTKHRKLFLFLRNTLFSKTVIFADFC